MKRSLIWGLVALGLSLVASQSRAGDVSSDAPVSPPEEARLITFNLSKQPLASALATVGEQANINVVFHSELSDGLVSSPLAGTFTAQRAFATLLSDTPLHAEFVDSHTVVVRVADAQPTTAPTPNNASNASQPIEESPPSSAQKQSDQQVPSPKASSDDSLTASTSDNSSKHGLPEILIKGSRVMNVDVKRSENDVQPYTIFDSAQIQQSGAVTVEDFLKQQLTMNTTVQTNSQAFISGNGTVSSINLRGLGTGETLILIDGRRSASVNLNQLSGTQGSQPDINGIPISAIERIEVLPSSASAIYGGAAMGGVINVILKRSFSGGDLSYTYDNVTSGSAPIRTVSASYGMSLKSTGTQLFVGGQYSDADPLLLQDRQDLIDRGVSSIFANSPSYLYNTTSPFIGAATNIAAQAAFDSANFPACSLGPSGILGCFTSQNLSLKNGTPLNSPITSVPKGATPGSDLSAGLLANAGRYNLALSPGTGIYGLNSSFGTPATVKSVFATIRQNLPYDMQVFTEFSTYSTSGRTSNNPLPTNSYAVSATSPVNPFQQSVTLTFPSSLFAPQTSDSVTRSATIGIVSPLPLEWRSELDYTWSENSFEFASSAADATAIQSDINSGALNPFVDTQIYPLSLASYLAPISYSGKSTLNDLGLRLSGPLISLPAGHPTVTVGLEHRKEGNGDGYFDNEFPLNPDNTIHEIQFGHSQSVNSAYVEALVPLVSSKNKILGVYSLDMQLAGRSERYTVFNGTAYEVLAPAGAFNPPQGVRVTTRYTSTNPTVGIKYKPFKSWTMRASYAKAFLPPTAAQLLANPTPLCVFPCSLITDPRNGASYSVNTIGGGNPGLHPQTSRSIDAGIIWEPEIVQGLRVDLEYYRITQPNFITTPTAQGVVDDPTLSDRVIRDPATGLITTVNTSELNAAEYRTSGWDLKTDYTKTTDVGAFDFRVAGTFIKYDQRQYALGSPFVEYAGYPNDGGEGKIKGNASAGWHFRGLGVMWTTTYYSNYQQIYSPGSPSLIQSPSGRSPVPAAQGSSTIPSQVYHDLMLSYGFAGTSASASRVERLLSDTTLQIGVKNILNSMPPFDASNQPYFYSGYGDPRLRSYRVSIRKSF